MSNANSCRVWAHARASNYRPCIYIWSQTRGTLVHPVAFLEAVGIQLQDYNTRSYSQSWLRLWSKLNYGKSCRIKTLLLSHTAPWCDSPQHSENAFYHFEARFGDKYNKPS